MSIKITGDSTIDLSNDLLAEYDVFTVPLYINMGAESHRDGISVCPEDIYNYYDETGNLPTTAAPSVNDYIEFFREQLKSHDEVIHFNISSEFSSAYQNAMIAAKEVGNVYPIDSRNLSTGTALLVLDACDMARSGFNKDQILTSIKKNIQLVEASFVINTLTYLHKGGRCSGVAVLGANLLKLKPSIHVLDGKMIVGKKYRGNYNRCIEAYVKDMLSGRDDINPKRIFLTHTKCDKETINIVKKAIEENYKFDEILETTAGCTITNHCGEGTLGILFERKMN